MFKEEDLWGFFPCLKWDRYSNRLEERWSSVDTALQRLSVWNLILNPHPSKLIPTLCQFIKSVEAWKVFPTKVSWYCSLIMRNIIKYWTTCTTHWEKATSLKPPKLYQTQQFWWKGSYMALCQGDRCCPSTHPGCFQKATAPVLQLLLIELLITKL